MRRTFDSAHDGGDDEGRQLRALMCQAHRCPNRWSVERDGSRLCSAHAWADPNSWPIITQEQLAAETDRALANGRPKPEPVKLTRQEKLEAAERLQVLLNAMRTKRHHPRAWAYALQEREKSGEALTEFQRKAWREALVDAAIDVSGEFPRIPPEALPPAMRPKSS